MKPPKKIIIKDGKITTLYDDDLAKKLHARLGGTANIKRASHIEAPEGNLETIEFQVDLTLSNGPILSGFSSYQDAVNAEVEWINKHKLTTKQN